MQALASQAEGSVTVDWDASKIPEFDGISSRSSSPPSFEPFYRLSKNHFSDS